MPPPASASANVALSAPSSVIAAAIAMTSLGSPRSATPGDPTLSAGANVSSSAPAAVATNNSFWGASSGQRLSSSMGPPAGDASAVVPPLALNCPKKEPEEADSPLLPPQAAAFHPPRAAAGGFGAMPTLSEAALAAAPYHHRAATMDHRAAAAAAVVNRPVAASLYAPSYHHSHHPPPFGGHHPMAAVPAGLLRLPPPGHGHGAPHPPPLSRPLPPAGATLEQQHHQPVISATKNFPATLHDVISSNVHAHVVSWLHHGRGFFIHDKQLFDSIILHRYFEGAKFTSFTRRLKRWGFKRTPRGPEIGAYYNEWFKRDEPALLQWMTCSSGAGSQAQVEEAKRKRKEREEDSDGDDDKGSKNPTDKDDEEADIRVGNIVVPKKKKKKANHSTEGSPRLTSRGGSEAVQNHGFSRTSSPDEAPPQLPPSPATVHKKKKKKKTTTGREIAVGAPIATEVLSINRAVGSDPSSLPRDYPSTLAPREGFDEQRMVGAQHLLLARSMMPPDVVASGQRQVLVPAYLVPAPIGSTPSNHHPYYAHAAAASAAESQRALDVERAKRVLEAERHRLLSAGGSHHRHQAAYGSQDVMAPPSNIMASTDPHGTMMGGAVSAARFQPLLPSPYVHGTEIPHSYRSGFEPVGRNDNMASTLSEAPHEAMMGGVSAASRFQPPRMAPPYDERGTGRPHDISSRSSGFEPMGRSVASTVNDASHDTMVGGVSAARFQGEARPIMMSREEERAFGEFLYTKKKAEMAQRW